eukprot:scaffold12201_cov75-Skeletonema_dohrnii-CCMP3373.AAC.3
MSSRDDIRTRPGTRAVGVWTLGSIVGKIAPQKLTMGIARGGIASWASNKMIAWRITAIVLSIVGVVLIPGVCAEGAPTVENIRFSNGDTWSGKGELEDGLIVNGKGIYKWANGEAYDGELRACCCYKYAKCKEQRSRDSCSNFCSI